MKPRPKPLCAHCGKPAGQHQTFTGICPVMTNGYLYGGRNRFTPVIKISTHIAVQP